MKHPSETDLALLAGGDLGWVERWQIGRHLKGCDSCRNTFAGLQNASQELASEMSELPAGLRWERLATEMSANIRVGIEAGECVAPVRQAAARWDWRAAAIMATTSAVVIGAWFLNPAPHPVEHAMRSAKVEIRTTAAGLELNENGNAMVLMSGSGSRSQRAIITSAPGNLRARYVDADTGQITINNVYSE